MTSEQWRAIKSIFQEACEIEPDQRLRFLTEACKGDADLRREVEKLLSADERVGETDETRNSGGDSQARGQGRSPWPRIGPYEVIREIGRGGMGTVYLASRADRAYSKEVAIKVIRRGLDNDFLLRRFRNERQILAALEHPYIAALFDGGSTESGLPYMVMEYVKGEEILSYSDAKRLTVRERLEIFRKVCSAVHYAHQNLVIHRDLKPGNILVAESGDPKLLDFGVSKLLDPDPDNAAISASSFPVVTPAYASPEQVSGHRVTTASDVYSLGVLLYELLAGRRPYEVDDSSPAATVRAICEAEPEKPSSAIERAPDPARGWAGPSLTSSARRTDPRGLRRALAGDVDTIIMTALRKEPERRYASVEHLSEDLRRHLLDLPVAARGGSILYRTAKLIRRNRKAAMAGSLAALSLLVGLAVAGWRARVEHRERLHAEERLAETRKVASSALQQIDGAVRDLPASVPARLLFAEKSVQVWRATAAAAPDDIAAQSGLVEASTSLSRLRLVAGDGRGAVAAGRGAVAEGEKLCEQHPGVLATSTLLAEAYHSLGDALNAAGDVDGAAAAFKQRISILEDLCKTSPRFLRELAGAYARLGAMLLDRGDHAAAIDACEKAAQSDRRLLAGNPTDAPLRIELASNLRSTALAYEAKGDRSRAIEYLSMALAERKTAAGVASHDSSNQVGLGLLYQDIGKVLSEQGDRQGAITNLAVGLRTIEALTKAEPNNTSAQLLLADICESLGRVYRIVPAGAPAAQVIAARNEALDHFLRGKKILEELSARGRLSPSQQSRRDRLSEEIAAVKREVGIGN